MSLNVMTSFAANMILIAFLVASVSSSGDKGTDKDKGDDARLPNRNRIARRSAAGEPQRAEGSGRARWSAARDGPG